MSHRGLGNSQPLRWGNRPDRRWGIRYDTCIRRGVVTRRSPASSRTAATGFCGKPGPGLSASRVYASSSDITSCDLPSPITTFPPREVKWIAQTIMIARPPFYMCETYRSSGSLRLGGWTPGPALGNRFRGSGSTTSSDPTAGTIGRSPTGYYWAANDYLVSPPA